MNIETGDAAIRFAKRELYEAELARRFGQWRRIIDELAGQATEQDFPGSIGNEQTQIQKLRGQWEMGEVQFDQLRAVNTEQAWEDLRIGLEKRAEELEEALAKIQAYFSQT